MNQVSVPNNLDSEMQLLLNQLHADPARYDCVVGLFLETLPPEIHRVAHAVGARDCVALRQAALHMEGSCLGMGAMRLVRLCDEMRSVASRGYLDQSRWLVGAMRGELRQLRAGLARDRRNVHHVS